MPRIAPSLLAVASLLLLLLATAPALAGEPAAPAPEKPCGGRHSVELVAKERDAGSAKLFVTEDGFDLFWLEHIEGGKDARPASGTFWMPLTRDGAPRAKPRKLLDGGPRHIARGDDGLYAITWQVRAKESWVTRVTIVRLTARGAKVVREVAVPLEGTDHGAVAIAWDPVARRWALAGEESFPLNPASRGYVYSRVFVARLSAEGKWIDEPRYLSGKDDGSASLSDWTNPLVWNGDRFAFAWSRGPGELVLSEMSAKGEVTHRVIAKSPWVSRAVVAPTPRGYALAWGGGADSGAPSRLSLVTVEGDTVGPVHDLTQAPGKLAANEPALAVAGSRIGLAWQEGWQDASAVYFAEIEAGSPGKPEIRPIVKERHAPPVAWGQALVWDGCRFALVWKDGINGGALRLELIP